MTSGRIRLLVTGSSGFVGRNLAEYFLGRTALYLADLEPPPVAVGDAPWHFMDVRDNKVVRDVMEKVRPDAVIHAAANKNVRWCQSHPDEAMEINALGTLHVAAQCRQLGVKMVYISTDLVFDCKRGHYSEADLPRPETAYGRSKLEGEKLAAAETADLAICRSGGIFGRYSPLLGWLRKMVLEGRNVECFTDVYNTPTYAVNLAEMIEYILSEGITGIYHTVGVQRVNRYELFKVFTQTFGYEESLLAPARAGARMKEMLLLPDASLLTEKSRTVIKVPFNSPTEGMSRMLEAGGLE